jgi:glutaredoxin-like protein NrdH
MDNINFTKVDGENRGEIHLFALSTCVWCKKTKALLDEKGLEYSYVFVDKLDEKEKKTVREVLKQWNPDVSYPTLIFNQKNCVVGFDIDKVDKELSNV